MMARFICGILSIYVTAHVVKADMMASSSLDVRHLQTSQTLNYRATYKADFQHLLDSDCMADKPILQISCSGTAMTILNRTDDTIVCTALNTPEIDNGMSYQCINTCTDCATIYEASGGIEEGPFAYIIFMCEGDDIEQVNAKYSFTAGNPGSCDFTVATKSRNFHVGRLGVLCPSDTGGRDYVYDDTYAECYIAGSATLSFATDTANQTENDIYTCVTGNNCDGKTCSVPFDDIDIYTTLPSFLSVCVETLATAGTTPTRAPQVSTGNTATEFKVQYEASWGKVLGFDAIQQSCASANPSISVKCLADSSIRYINSTDASMICNAVSDNELSCSGDASAIVDAFTTVTYTCVGPNAPISQVTYPDASVSCLGNSKAVTISHAVTLGLLCRSETRGLIYFYGDNALECAEAGNNFATDATLYGFDFDRYVCSESATFSVGSTVPQIIRNVTILSDEVWVANVDACYDVVPVPTAPTVPVPVANPPLLSPTKMLSASPTLYPSAVPSIMTVTQAPIAKTSIPKSIDGTNAPTDSINTPSQQGGGESKSVVGVAVGSAVGGVALAVVIGFLVLWSQRQQSSKTTKPDNGSSYGNHQYTESNNDDDFASSRSPAASSGYNMGGTNSAVTAALVQPSPMMQQPSPLYPITEVSSNTFHTSEASERISKRDVFVPTPDMPPPMPHSVATQHTVSSSSSSQRSAYPANHDLNVKDQCRSVAMVRSSSPTLISQSDTSHIPFAVALGVSTTSSAMASVVSSTSSNNTKKEPSGRILLDV